MSALAREPLRLDDVRPRQPERVVQFVSRDEWKALTNLNRPEPGMPLQQGCCSVCGEAFGHSEPHMNRCGLCRMDAVNRAYDDRNNGWLVVRG